jgi:hypothetical protein
MQKKIKAIFYEFKYYLLPDGYSSAKELEEGEHTLIRLREEFCLAPDFVIESECEENVEITDKNRLFDAEVNLYERKEYDEILLSRVKSLCKGCTRYTDDGKDGLDGHHREMSLGGVCYERSDGNDNYDYSARVYGFYDKLESRADDIADCIEKGKAKKLNKICMECASDILRPKRFYGSKRDGKYWLFMQTGLSELGHVLLAYTAFAARSVNNPVNQLGLNIIPFIPKDAVGYDGKIRAKKPVAQVVQSEIPWRYDISVYFDGDPDDAQAQTAFDDLHARLAFALGEDLVFRTVESYGVTRDKNDLKTVEEICAMLEEADGMQESDGFPPDLPYGWEDAQNALPYRRNSSGITNCCPFINICYDGDASHISFGEDYSYAYLYFPYSGENDEGLVSAAGWYVGGETLVPEPVVLKEEFVPSCMPIGVCSCGDGFAFDFFVADEKRFYRFIKILAPVLSATGARLIMVNDDGVTEYVCGNEIVPADSTGNN